MTMSKNKCFTPQINKQINDKCMNFKLRLPKGLTSEANVFVTVSSFTGYEECLTKICEEPNFNPNDPNLCFNKNIFNSIAFTYTSFKKYTGPNDININCLDKKYKYKIKVSIVDNVGDIDNVEWFNLTYETVIRDYPNIKILVKTLSVNNKTNTTIYLTDMVKIPIDALELPCPNDETLAYANPIGVAYFLAEYNAYLKTQRELIRALDPVNQQPLKNL